MSLAWRRWIASLILVGAFVLAGQILLAILYPVSHLIGVPEKVVAVTEDMVVCRNGKCDLIRYDTATGLPIKTVMSDVTFVASNGTVVVIARK